MQEQVDLAIKENEISKVVGENLITRDDIVTKLENEGKLTEQEADLLLGRNGQNLSTSITIGEISINFGELNKMDNIPPSVNVVVEETENYGELKVTVTASDADSDLSEDVVYNYYLKLSSNSEEYLNEATYSGTENVHIFSTSTYSENQYHYYDVKVIVNDNAGNEGYGEAIKVTPLVKPCFVAGTKVSTLDGLKNIEEIEVGDKVYTYNEEKKEVEIHEVIFTSEHEVIEIYKIIFNNGEEIQNTKEHPYYVVGKGWVMAENLEIGDEVFTQDNKILIIEEILVNSEESVKVYNITVENNHNYFVGTSKILVHNKA